MKRKEVVVVETAPADATPPPTGPSAAMSVSAQRAPYGSIHSRIDALRLMLATIEACRCESCFHLAIAARERIAALAAWQ